MKNLLIIQSSSRGNLSTTQSIVEVLIKQFKDHNPENQIRTRDLAANPLPHIDGAYLIALGTPTEQRTPEQLKTIEGANLLIEEVLTADTILIAAPMYNFSIPSTLKAWIDHIVQAGRTFKYGSNGPEGLLINKKAILVLASGGVYSSGAAKAFDFQEPYLRTILAFLGVTDTVVIRVEGVANQAIGAEKAIAIALEKAKQLE
jgi:FMN-dependent NADH-azoreductase